nr:uncharacterized protein LOC124815607 isoform X3 [Hydra vulgaris]
MSEEINYAQAIESLYEKLNTMENTIMKPSSSSSMIVPATTTAVSPNSKTVVASTFNIAGSSVDNSVVKSAESTGSSVVNSVVTSTSSTARSQDTQTVVASASNIVSVSDGTASSDNSELTHERYMEYRRQHPGSYSHYSYLVWVEHGGHDRQDYYWNRDSPYRSAAYRSRRRGGRGKRGNVFQNLYHSCSKWQTGTVIVSV